ncbi:hypothetical protein ACFX14_029050 [Malus domestica]
MAITSCGSNGNHIKIDGAGSSDELDYLPLIQRRNLLLVGKQNLKSLIGVTVKEEDELSNFFCSSGGGMNGFAGSSVLAVQMKSEISDHSTYDHLDHISLKERQKMLQSRKLFGFEKALIEDIPGPLSKDLMQQLACKGQADTSSAGGEALVATSSLHDNSGRNSSVVCRTSMISSPHNVIVEAFSTTYQYSVNSSKSNYGGKGSESDKKCSSERMPPNATELSSCGGQDYLPTCTSRRHCSTPSTSVKVKDEPWDDGVFQNQDRNAGKRNLITRPDHDPSSEPSDSVVPAPAISQQPKRPKQLERSESLLAKQKRTAPIIVCCKRSSSSSKPSAAASSFGQTLKRDEKKKAAAPAKPKVAAKEQVLRL